jgi:hypothetical protein
LPLTAANVTDQGAKTGFVEQLLGPKQLVSVNGLDKEVKPVIPAKLTYALAKALALARHSTQSNAAQSRTFFIVLSPRAGFSQWLYKAK